MMKAENFLTVSLRGRETTMRRSVPIPRLVALVATKRPGDAQAGTVTSIAWSVTGWNSGRRGIAYLKLEIFLKKPQKLTHVLSTI
jgi:hypothetical protein